MRIQNKSKLLLFTLFLALAFAIGINQYRASSTPRAGAIVINNTPVPPLPTLSPDRIREGEMLYAQYCARCHGSNLEGDPEWQTPLEDGSLRPPPHNANGHTWHHADSLLIQIISQGGDPAVGGVMPGFGEQLNEDEIRSILEFIKTYWDDEQREFQWWVTVTQSD